ncbi:MAG: hypothetical protein ABI559_01485 [Chloroflexota bacterium]
MFLFSLAVGFFALASLFIVLITPKKTVSPLLIAEGAAVCVGCWIVAFAAPFVAESGSTSVGFGMTLAALAVFVAAVSFEARRLNPGWSAYLGAILFAGAMWAVSFGIYAEHAVGWQALRLEDVDQNSIWLGAFFAAPTAALPGILVGVIASMMARRMRAMTAAAA